MVLPVVRAEKKQGFTSPPKVYTEDTLLSAMETAGNKEFDKDTEKKGLGTLQRAPQFWKSWYPPAMCSARAGR